MKFNISELYSDCIAFSIENEQNRIGLVFKSKPNVCQILNGQNLDHDKQILKFDLKTISKISFANSGLLIAAVSG